MSLKTSSFLFFLVFIGSFLEVLTQDESTDLEESAEKLLRYQQQAIQLKDKIQKYLPLVVPKIESTIDYLPIIGYSFLKDYEKNISSPQKTVFEKEAETKFLVYRLIVIDDHLEKMNIKYPANVEKLSHRLKQCTNHTKEVQEILRIKYSTDYQLISNETRLRLLKQNEGNNAAKGIQLNDTKPTVEEIYQQLDQCVLDSRELLHLLAKHQNDYKEELLKMNEYIKLVSVTLDPK